MHVNKLWIHNWWWLDEHLPSGKQLCYLYPAVSKSPVSPVDDEVFLSSPRRFLHIGIEVVVPALSALFPEPALQMLGYQCPLLVAIEIDKLYNLGIIKYASHNKYDSDVKLLLSKNGLFKWQDTCLEYTHVQNTGF